MHLNLRPRKFFDSKMHGMGFTLLEIVIVLSLLSLLVAAAVPSFSGIQAERALRDPLIQLANTAKEVRLRAMKEKRPYQIVFTSTGFTASRYLSPYLQLAEFQNFLSIEEQLLENADSEKEEPAEAKNPLGFSHESLPQSFQKITLPEGSIQKFQYWYESTPTEIGNNIVKLWVFQPNGLCEPIRIRFQGQTHFVEATFNAITADIVQESSGTL